MNLAALDIGTNSFHLVVARPVAGSGFETITREKEVVRLGSGGGDMKLLTPEAIDRGVACLTRMRGIAESHNAVMRAVATSATREAVNSRDFIERAAAEAGVEIDVISGLEEARLIHLGVLQAVPVFDRRLLLIDVGGGSTELLIGECGETLAARSFKLGAVRLTDRYFPDGDVTPKAVRACRSYIRGVVEHFSRDVTRFGFEVAISSSGTAETVARMVHATRGSSAFEPLRTYNCFEFATTELDAVVDRLTEHRTASARAKLDGLESTRADIIVAGALILATVAETFGIDTYTFSEAALREGVLLDTMNRIEGDDRPGAAALHHLRDVSRRSINQLVERCDEDPAHSRHVAGLAVSLFDELTELHDLTGRPREYLEAAALLANVGLVIAHSKHHLHAYYIIRNSELAGLTDGEIELIAQIARYHRKSEPKASHQAFAALDADQQRLVRSLAGVLRVAIGLDRRHEGRVLGATVDRAGPDGPLRVLVKSDEDVSLEIFAADERKGLLEQVVGRAIEIAPA
ncbi:Ppx/GppA phosphatase family protein [Desertimonas flava]|uniref:Ppx/GppA phosphatase family protein n=1 Tax=Desertimonas flava TaxID=2064846 RepID=UPI000E349226|nr:Ppx/GppA phosphatase family protein [Desertimonas flava]